MSQGDAWKMGVALPIPNPSFRHPSKFATKLSGAYTSGTQLNCVRSGTNGWQGVAAAGGYGNMIVHYLSPGDRVTIGPSTASGYEGRVEKAIVAFASGSSDLINLTAALIYDYAVGDPVTGIGTTMPGGWTLSDPIQNGLNIASYPIETGSGYDDLFNLRLSKIASTGDIIVVTAPAQGPSGYRYLPPLEPSTIYRLAAYVKANTSIATGSKLQLLGNATYSGAAFAVTTSWVERTATVTSGATETSNSAIALSLPAALVFNNYLHLDCIGICHAKYTDDATTGIYTFDSLPDANSPKLTPRNTSIGATAISQRQINVYPGGPDMKYIVQARFSQVNDALLQNLQILYQWQLKGNLLLLQPNITRLPPYIYGSVQVSTVGKDHWDLDNSSIDFQFTEA
jgi:hypothetical protein